MDNSLQPEAISTSQAVSPAASSLGRSLSSLPAVRRRPPASAPLTWLGWDLICASFTGPGETKPATVWPPAAGRETRPPGACQHRHPWSACLCHRPAPKQADTGAANSILLHQSSTLPSGPPLAGPNGRPIACWGDKPVQLFLDNRRFQWTFLLAAVQCPIIGVDFIRAHHLLVDPFNNRLLDLSTFRSLKADTDKPQLHSPGVSSVDKTEGGCAQAHVAHSTPPGSSTPSLPPASTPSQLPLPLLPNSQQE